MKKKDMKWKIDGYISAAVAARSAYRRGVVGLTGSGQECGPFCLDGFQGCRGFVYVTWDNQWIIPGGIVSEKLQIEVMTE